MTIASQDKIAGQASFRSLSKAALLLGTALVGSLAFAPTSALAACSNTIGFSITATCSNATTGGHTAIAVTNVTVNFGAGATLANNGNALTLGGAGNLTFNMNNSNNVISSVNGIGVTGAFVSGTSNLNMAGTIIGGTDAVNLTFTTGTVNATLANTSTLGGGTGDGFHLNIIGGASANITANGRIYGGGDGIDITALGGTVNVTNNGIIGRPDVNPSIAVGGNGINVGVGVGSASVTNNGVIYSNGAGVNVVAGGAVTVNNTNSIETVGANSAGIFAVSLTKAVNVNGTGGEITTAADGGPGIFAGGLGNVTIAGTGNIDSGNGQLTLPAIGAIGTFAGLDLSGGVLAVAGGNVAIGDATNGLPDTTITTTGNFGILAGALGGATVNAQGSTIDAANGTGIAAIALGGDAVVNSGQINSGTGGITLPAGIDLLGGATIGGGIVAVSGAGNAFVTTDGSTTTAGAFGVFAVAPVGGVTVDTTGGDVTAANGTGVFALGGGAVSVTSGNIESGAGGITLPAGIDVLGGASIGGGVLAISLANNVDVTTKGTTTTDGLFGVLAAAPMGAVTVNTEGGLVEALSGIGVAALGAGNVEVTTGAVTSGAGGIDLGGVVIGGGILAGSLGGDVKVAANGDVNSAGSFGIFAAGAGNATVTAGNVAGGEVGVSALAVGGNANVTTTGAVSGNLIGIDAIALGAGEVNVTTTGGAVNSASGVGIVTGANSGQTTIVTGDVTGGLGGIAAVSVSGGITISGGSEINGGAGIGITAVTGGASDIVIDGTWPVTGGAGGILATHLGSGNVEITGTGDINSANGFGVTAIANTGDINIATAGNITAGLIGVSANTLEGSVRVTIAEGKTVTSGGVGISAIAGGAIGIDTSSATVIANGPGVLAVGGGAVTVDAGVTQVQGGGGFMSGGVLAFGGGDTVVNVNGKISVTDGTFGALAVSTGGNATVNVDAMIDPPLIGAAAVTIGAGTATTNVNAVTEAHEIGALAANFGTGDVVINTTVNGEIRSSGIGLLAVNVGDGDTTVTARAAIGGYPGGSQAENGIVVFNAGDGDVSVSTSRAATIDASNDGVSVYKAGDGTVEITTRGRIDAGDDGIQLVRALGDGNDVVRSLGRIVAGDDGINVDRHLGDGNVTVFARGRISAGDDGVEVVRTTGDGNVTVIATDRINAGDDGVSINRHLGDGDVSVVARDRINADDDGIEVIRTTGDGNVAVIATDRINAGDDGINVDRHLGDGNVTVFARGRINAGDDGIEIIRTTGEGNIGVDFRGRILANDNGVSIVRGADAGDTYVGVQSRSRIEALNGDGIQVVGVATAGDVTIDVERATIRAVNGSAIDVITGSLTGDNNVNVYNDGRLIGAGTLADPTVRVIADGNVFIDNDGSIRTADNNPAGVAVAALSGENVVLANTGYIRGSVFLGSVDLVEPTASVTFDNDGYWRTSGFSGFGAVGSVEVNNYGYVRTSGVTTFGFISGSNTSNHYNNYDRTDVNGVLNILMAAPDDANYVANSGRFNVNGALNVIGGEGLTFANGGGIVDMRYGWGTADRVFISGDYYGGVSVASNSRLGIDTYLGGPGSTSDLMTVGVSTNGVTSVIVRDANYNGPGAYNPTGIEFVNVTSGDTQLGQFVLSADSDHYDASRGVLDKGLFFYDVATRDNGDGSRSQVLIGAPDSEVFELPRAITAAQNIWHESAGVWLDRQADLRHQLMKQIVAPAPVVSKGYDAPAPIMTMVNGPITPGVWLKGVGSWTDRDDRVRTSVLDRSYSFDLGYKQDTYGLIGGIDFGTRGMHNPNDALVFGALAGYLKSDLDFSRSQNGYSFEGGTVGLYATYLNNGFFADLLGKADLLKMSWSAPSLQGYANTRGDRDANSYGFRFDTGYRYSFSPGFFIEPSATIAYVKTSIDSFDIPGGRVNWQDGESFRGALGLRVGGTFAATSDLSVEASLTGRVWNEFSGDNKVTILTAGPTFIATDSFDGTFGEVAGSLNFFGNKTGWTGFINAGVKFNDDFTTTTAKAGVRYVFGKAPAPAPVPAVVSVRY